MIIQVSRTLRQSLENRFLGDFNANLEEACAEFGIAGYQINFTESPTQPQNFYRGNRTLDALTAVLEPELPALAMWIGPALPYGPGQREMSRTFSGSVSAGWRFFLGVKGLRTKGLVDLCEATESAMIATLAPEGIGYHGDLAWGTPPEQIWVDQDDKFIGFVQEIEFQASFEVQI